MVTKVEEKAADTKAAIIDGAKQMIALGLPIIPVCSPTHNRMSVGHKERCKNPGKTPLIKNWQNHNNTTEVQLKEWQQSFGEFNLGLPLGDASGYVGIDVDGEQGVDLLMSMSGGILPNTWEFSTAAGSRLLYKIPTGLVTKKFKQTAAGAHQECAILCSGQQTVMPPSVHATGYTYTWQPGHEPWTISCGLAPDWLLDLITQESIPEKRTIVAGLDWSSEFGTNAGAPGVALGEAGYIESGYEDEHDENSYSEDNNDSDNYGNAANTPLSQGQRGQHGAQRTQEKRESDGNEFSLDLPADVSVKASTGKRRGRKKKGLDENVLTELLTRRIPDGERDNTMTQIVGHFCANRDLRRMGDTGKKLITQMCLEHNRNFCDPPLEDNAILSKVNYFLSTEEMKDGVYAAKKGIGRGEEVPFNPKDMAQEVLTYIEKEEQLKLHFDQFSRLYYYTEIDKGPWKRLTNMSLLHKWIRGVVSGEFIPGIGSDLWNKHAQIEEVRRAIEEFFVVAFKKEDDFDLGAHQDVLAEYIVLRNGVLHWRESRSLTSLREWSPEYKTTIAFDFDYDPMAECPLFERYLSEWLPDESVRLVLQEFLGYCLIPNTNFRKAIFLYGKGRNGKSMLIEFLQRFFGEHSSTLSYDGLFQRFGTSQLKDKLVNIFDDTTVTFTKETSAAKNLIAGGKLSAEFKGKDAFEFVNTARFIFSSQETPRTSDTSLAWYDRWFFIQFTRTFRASNSKKIEMQTAMATELPGIFNWMLQGLVRLVDNDEFTHSPLLDRHSMEYRAQNDSVVMFLQNMCLVGEDNPNGRVAISSLYKVYQAWTTAESLRPVSKKVFILRAEDLGLERKTGSVRGVAGSVFFKGLSFNAESSDYKEYVLEINLALS